MFALMAPAALLLAACPHASDPSSPSHTTSVSGAERTPAVELVLELRRNSAWHAELVNRDSRPIDIVMPGDGSSRGLRSPIVAWQRRTDDGSFEEVLAPGCGNYNALEPDGVVALLPGDSVTIPPIGLSYLPVPRNTVATVVLTYEHDPDMQWSDGAMNAHHGPTMSRVRACAPLSLRSNEVQVERDESGVLRLVDQEE